MTPREQYQMQNLIDKMKELEQQLTQANETIKQLKRTINEIVTHHTNT